MARRLAVVALVFVLIIASVVAFAVAPAWRAPAASSTLKPEASSISSINYTYSDFFNVPWGEWWDMRTNSGYGDEPVGASCFNATSVADTTCKTNVGGIPRVATYPYEDWLGPAGTATIFAPYRVSVKATGVTGYNLSQPVIFPVTNYGTPPGNTLQFNLNMQYLDLANFTRLTSSPLSCYSGTANKEDGYQLVTKIYLTLDNQEAARLFGTTVGTQSAVQGWWNTNTLAGCSGSKSQSGAFETALNSWFQNQANTKWTIQNGYAGAYISLYTNVTATVVSGGATGITHVYIEHGAWGTEALLDRMFYWGNQTYTGSQLSSAHAAGWWGMENGWWEGLHYAGTFTPLATAFNLTGVLQYHFQERSLPGPDGTLRSSTNTADVDDVPVWTWGPQLLDYVAATVSNPYSELSRFNGLNYFKSTPGSGDYGTNTSFEYTPVSWAARPGETWWFQFPTTSAAYYANPDAAAFGTTLPGTQLPTITSTLELAKFFPSTYGTWNPATWTWGVTGGTPPSWPASTGSGTYPYYPYPGIFLGPASLPPVVTTVAASGVNTTAATLNGNLGSKGSASTVSEGFLWGTSPTLVGASNFTVSSSASVGPFSHALTGLASSTTFYFQAWADGASFVKGAIMSFTTATPAAPPTVTTVGASGITTSAATLNGDLTGLGTAPTVTVGFLWGTSPTLTGATNTTPVSRTTTGAFSNGLTGLASATTYYFQAWANGQGFASGSIMSFTTASVGAAPSVATDPASAITTTTAQLNGATSSLGTASTVTVGFLWGTSATLSGATNVTVGTQTGTPGSFLDALAGLSPGVTYYFEAWANGNGFANGVILPFTTAVIPPTVTTVAASSVGTTAATLNGLLGNPGTASSVTVGFYWGTSATLVGATNATVGPMTASGPFTDSLTTLSPGVTYYFRAWASGQGFVNGTIMSFTTSTTPPTVVTNAAGAISTNGAYLYGDLTGLGTASSVTVGFFWGTSPALVGATNATATSLNAAGPFQYVVGGLTPGTTYYFRAWANGQGFVNGSILSFITAVTPPVVTTNGATGVSPTAATLNGATTSFGTASSVGVGFYWGTSATLAGAANVSVTTQNAIGAFSSGITGLTLGTTYYFQAWANGDGFSTGTILSFVAASTPPSVTTAAASAVTFNSAILNGNLVDLGTATTVTVGFYWGTSSSLVGATNDSIGTRGAAVAFVDALTGLTPSTTYYFRAWASGDGFINGSIMSFTTSARPTAPSVATSAATGITATAASLNGDLTALGSATTVTVGFYWGTSATLVGATNATAGSMTGTGMFTKALSGLTSGTTYYFRAYASGDGFVQGSILQFTTAVAIAPPSASSAAATSIGDTGATLNGNLAGLGSASSVTVGFLWSTNADLSQATNVTVGTRTAEGAFSNALTGLQPGTRYYFAAWVNGVGFVRGSIETFTTTGTAPGPTFLGLPALIGYGLVAAIIIVVAALSVLLLMRQRRKSPPETPPPENP